MKKIKQIRKKKWLKCLSFYLVPWNVQIDTDNPGEFAQNKGSYSEYKWNAVVVNKTWIFLHFLWLSIANFLSNATNVKDNANEIEETGKDEQNASDKSQKLVSIIAMANETNNWTS